MITGLDHATIVTRKMDETCEFFRATLGLELGPRPNTIPGYWLYGGGNPILHIFSTPEDRPPAGGIDHISFATPDLAPVLARLDELGVPYHTNTLPGGHGVQAFCKDPNGIKIEITCRTPAAVREARAAEAVVA